MDAIYSQNRYMNASQHPCCAGFKRQTVALPHCPLTIHAG